MRLFKSVHSIAGIVAGIDHAKRAQPSAHPRMGFYHVYRDTPEMRAAGGGILSANRSGNASQRILAAQQNHTAKQGEDQCQGQAGFYRRTLDTRWPFFMSLLVTMTAQSHSCHQKKEFGDQA